MSSLPKRRYTLEEYFELDLHSEEKLEYWNGEIFSRNEGGLVHNRIKVNLIGELGTLLKDRPCRIFPSEQRVKVPAFPPYRYPDLTALCGKAEFQKIGGVDTLLNPTLIVEILSPTTEALDRGDKFTDYKSIPSFCEYVLIAQHRPHVSQYVKKDESKWIHMECNSLEGIVYLQSLDCRLSLNEVYLDVEFPPAPDSRLPEFEIR